jgi:nitroreductase
VLTVSEAVRRRHSCRAFLSEPVDRAAIEDILAAASRAPSGGNLQPWRVDAVAGEALERLKAEVREQLSQGLGPTEFDVYPAAIGLADKTRRRACGEALYESLRIDRGDKAGRWAQFLRNYDLFGAPVGLFFSLGREFDRPQWAHLGMFMQTIMLLAEERGLATCAQESWAAVHAVVEKQLALPPDRIFYAAIALGRPDRDQPVNGFRTEREPIASFARFHGL